MRYVVIIDVKTEDTDPDDRFLETVAADGDIDHVIRGLNEIIHIYGYTEGEITVLPLSEAGVTS